MFKDEHAILTSASAALYERRRLSNVRPAGCVVMNVGGTAGCIQNEV